MDTKEYHFRLYCEIVRSTFTIFRNTLYTNLTLHIPIIPQSIPTPQKLQRMRAINSRPPCMVHTRCEFEMIQRTASSPVKNYSKHSQTRRVWWKIARTDSQSCTWHGNVPRRSRIDLTSATCVRPLACERLDIGKACVLLTSQKRHKIYATLCGWFVGMCLISGPRYFEAI